MYKGAQEKQDWLSRTGSHATRPVLSANVNNPIGHFERGALPELKDEQARLKKRLIGLKDGREQHRICTRLSVISVDIKRLNREAAETSERELMWKALKQAFTEKQIRRFSENLMRLRMLAEGEWS